MTCIHRNPKPLLVHRVLICKTKCESVLVHECDVGHGRLCTESTRKLPVQSVTCCVGCLDRETVQEHNP